MAAVRGSCAMGCGIIRTCERLAGSVIDDKVEGLDADDDWGRRRSSIRHEVKLHGVIYDRKSTPIACTIDDISATGMALRLDITAADPGRELLQQGSGARLEFSPDPPHPEIAKFVVPVQVMWRTPIGAGIRFKKIDDTLRAALRGVAKAAVESRVEANPALRHTLAIKQRKTMLACRKAIEKLLPNMIWTLRTETVRRLRHVADGATAATAREARAAADLIDEKANAIGRTIERLFLQELAETSDLDRTQELTVAPMFIKKAIETTSPAVNVVEHQVAEQDSTIIAIAHAATERYKLKLFQLNIRLASVLGHPPDHSSNPLEPENSCRIFWQATVEFCDTPIVRRCLHDAIRMRIVPLLGELYDALDKILDEQGVHRAFDHMS